MSSAREEGGTFFKEGVSGPGRDFWQGWDVWWGLEEGGVGGGMVKATGPKTAGARVSGRGLQGVGRGEGRRGREGQREGEALEG